MGWEWDGICVIHIHISDSLFVWIAITTTWIVGLVICILDFGRPVQNSFWCLCGDRVKEKKTFISVFRSSFTPRHLLPSPYPTPFFVAMDRFHGVLSCVSAISFYVARRLIIPNLMFEPIFCR